MTNISVNSLNQTSNYSRPLSFIEWSNYNVNIPFSKKEQEYKKYLVSFNKNLTEQKSALTNLKNDYKELIKKLGIIFNNDEDFKRYTTIDLDSETDLTISIPKYAEKLKELALFFISKRNELGNKKIEYSLVGSSEGLEKILKNKLINTFTKNNRTSFNNENPLISVSPSLSSIQEDFSIEIQELYNTVDPYHTQDELNPFACLFNDICSNIYSVPISGYSDPLFQLNCDYNTDKIESVLQKAYDKYLGSESWYISSGYFGEKVISTSIDFKQGDNYFYWFSGASVYDIPEGRYENVNINDVEWNATGGNTLDESDVIYTLIGDEVNGAWFYDTEYIQTSGVMVAKIDDGKIFKFPFPNFGLSAFGGEWSGPSIQEDTEPNKEYYPSEEVFQNRQREVQNLYWNSFSSVSTVIPINIQDTTLGKIGGYSNNDYNKADKIYIYNDSNRFMKNSRREGWLFNFNQTQLPIKPGLNNIYFPIQRYESTDELFFQYTSGSDITLSSIDVSKAFLGAVAGQTIEKSDIIIKQRSFCGPELEAAWLKSPNLSYLNSKKGTCSCILDNVAYSTGWEYISGGIQTGISIKVDAGQYVRFVWTGEDTDINNVRGFTGFEHDDSCPYKFEDHSVSLFDTNYLNDTNQSIFEKWKKCTCGAIHYSPFGHNNVNLLSLGITPDFIATDFDYPNPFNDKTWKDGDGNNWLSSSYVARFSPNIIEKDGGWGEGTWKNNNNSSFILKKGQSYIYYRSIISDCNFESPYIVLNVDVPEFKVSTEECVKTLNKPVWMKAVQNSDGEWVDAGVESDMTLSFGDFIIYNHRDFTVETRRKLLYNGTDVSSVSGETVILNSNDPLISFIDSENIVPSINFLIKIPLENSAPYWGEYNGQSVNIVFDYLRSYQPAPLNITLINDTIIEYKLGCGGQCYFWNQPLQFNTYNPIKEWRKININPYVRSDILEYLNKEENNCNKLNYARCFSDCSDYSYEECNSLCSINKKGIIPSNEKSDIIFNVELSGVPVFIHYNAKSEFTQTFDIIDSTNGLSSTWIPAVSGLISSGKYPWRELLNNASSKFVIEEKDTLSSASDLGFFIPENIGMNKFETLDSEYYMSSDVVSLTSFSYENYFNNKKKKTIKNISSGIEKFFGENTGVPNETLQNGIPYKKQDTVGLFDTQINSIPWTDASIKNFRNQYNVTCENGWESKQLVLSGDVSAWDSDLYGNHYFLIHDENIDYRYGPTTAGTLYIKDTNNNISNLTDSLSSVLEKYKNINVSDEMTETFLVTEDEDFLITENGYFIIL